MLLLLFLVAIPVGIAVWFIVGQDWWRRRRRAALARQPFPSHWQDWLRTRTSIYAASRRELLPRLQELIRIFVGEKTFVGCNGLTVTEEMRVVIAAYACLLVANRPDVPRSHFYDDLFSILVYPTAFVVPHTHRDGHGVVTEGHRVLSGQAWDSRRIIVSWQDIEDGLATGHNVVLHEFAHYLDMEDETMDGAPGLGSSARIPRMVERVLGGVRPLARGARSRTADVSRSVRGERAGGILRRGHRSILREAARAGNAARRLVRAAAAILPGRSGAVGECVGLSPTCSPNYLGRGSSNDNGIAVETHALHG